MEYVSIGSHGSLTFNETLDFDGSIFLNGSLSYDGSIGLFDAFGYSVSILISGSWLILR